MYTAERGHGAYLNDKRLRVAARKNLTESVIATGLPFLGRTATTRASGELARDGGGRRRATLRRCLA